MTYLPAQPLIDYIARRGGVIEFFPHHKVDANGELDTRRDNQRRALHPEDRRSYNAALNAVSRAKDTGTITRIGADMLCVRLGLHPAEVYGDDWFEFEDVA